MNMFSAEGGGKTAAELAAEQRAAKQRAAAQKKAAQQKAAAQKAMQKATGTQKASPAGKNTVPLQLPLNTRAMEYAAADMGLPTLPAFMPQPTQQAAGVQKKATGAQKASPGKNTATFQLPLNTRAMEYAAADMGLPLLPSFMPQPTQQAVGVQKKAAGAQKASSAKNAATFQLPLNTRAMEYAAADMGLPMLPGFVQQVGSRPVKLFPTGQEAQDLTRQAWDALKKSNQWEAPPLVNALDLNPAGRALTETAQKKFQEIAQIPWTMTEEIADALENVGDVLADKDKRKNLLSKEFWGRNAMAGLWGIDKSLANTADMVLPDVPGVQDILRWYQNDGAGWEEKAAQTNEELGLEGLGRLTQDTVQAVPQLLLTLLGGAPASTLEKLGGAQGIQAMVGSLMKNPMFWSSYLTTAGNSYVQAKKEGANELQAQAMGLLNGAMNAAIEVGGGIKGIKTAPAGLKGLAQTAWEEGSENVQQDLLEKLLGKGLYRQDAPWASMTDENAVVNPLRIGTEFGTGALMGGLLGAGGLAVNRGLEALRGKRLFGGSAAGEGLEETSLAPRRQDVDNGMVVGDNQTSGRRTTGSADDALGMLDNRGLPEETRGSGSIENGPYIKDGKPNGRPQLSGERKLQFEQQVYNNNVSPDGILRDPNTGDVIDWKPGQPRKGFVDFGHKTGSSYNDMFQKYKNGEISLSELKEFQFSPDNYRLETPSANRSHKYE